MPLRYARKMANQALVALWDAREPEVWFQERLHLAEEEVPELARIHASRRLDWYSTRYLIHLLSGLPERTPVIKDTFGRPSLRDDHHRVSISHSDGLAAIALSDRAAGIDVQRWDPRMEKLAPRFLTSAELEAASGPQVREITHLYWGAKEALYKAHGWRRLNFKQHLACGPVDYDPRGGTLEGLIRIAPDRVKAYQLHYHSFEDAILVWALDIHEPPDSCLPKD
jgi:4'-phosphopantetheinyl transferase